ncbi:hypothetical protein [Alloactinosynnema sp. L-07]|nr:hypothetical protein [Alloactinosynnema sp. L-07]
MRKPEPMRLPHDPGVEVISPPRDEPDFEDEDETLGSELGQRIVDITEKLDTASAPPPPPPATPSK